MDLTARRLEAGDKTGLAAVLDLLHAGFAGMEGRIDPPSSLHRLDLAALGRQAASGEVWVLGTAPVACVVLTSEADHLHIGKLCVAPGLQRRGLARRLVDLAAARARALDLPALELQTRIELTENHLTFARLGFTETGRSAHPGYDRPTSIRMRRALA